MRLKIDKRLLKAGSIIEVTWDAEEASSPRLVMHTGTHETTIAVPESGSKKFRLKSSGLQWIGLRCWAGNQDKLIRKHLCVYGKGSHTDKFEYIDRPNWWSRLKGYCSKYWNYYTPEKRRLYVVLLMLIAYQILLSCGLFQVSQIAIMGITLYLFWQIVKR